MLSKFGVRCFAQANATSRSFANYLCNNKVNHLKLLRLMEKGKYSNEFPKLTFAAFDEKLRSTQFSTVCGKPPKKRTNLCEKPKSSNKSLLKALKCALILFGIMFWVPFYVANFRPDMMDCIECLYPELYCCMIKVRFISCGRDSED